MKRRGFLRMAWRWVWGVPLLAACTVPRCVTEAWRVLRYPGRVEALDAGSVKRMGRWGG